MARGDHSRRWPLLAVVGGRQPSSAAVWCLLAMLTRKPQHDFST